MENNPRIVENIAESIRNFKARSLEARQVEFFSGARQRELE